jgi:co-chaperonin GroES (HSP10)
MIRPTQDNVLLKLLPDETVSPGGIVIPGSAHGRRAVDTRRAVVLAVGPGHYRTRRERLGATEHTVTTSVLVPTELKVGEVVLVHARAGQNYDLDINVPRHNKPAELDGELRIVREDEVLCVLESASEAAE